MGKIDGNTTAREIVEEEGDERDLRFWILRRNGETPERFREKKTREG